MVGTSNESDPEIPIEKTRSKTQRCRWNLQNPTAVALKSYLVGGFNLPLWKNWVRNSWDDEIPKIWWQIKHVWNHQPEFITLVIGIVNPNYPTVSRAMTVCVVGVYRTLRWTIVDLENLAAFPGKMIYQWCFCHFSSTSILVYLRIVIEDIIHDKHELYTVYHNIS